MLIAQDKKLLLRTLIVIVLLYVLPVLIFKTYDFLFDFRFIIFGELWFSAIVYTLLTRHGWKELGFSNSNLINSLVENGVFTILSIPLLLVLHSFIQPDVAYRPLGGGLDLAIIYIFLFAPIQEFIFRGLLFAELKNLTSSNSLQILISSGLFLIFHLIYTNKFLIFSSSVAGVFWNFSYARNRNIYGVIFSHSI
ncbi:MAG: CPBP family intramembrane glutamic endopeptidase, partial [Xenococcus sp. (in: cyanobacteria)]